MSPNRPTSAEHPKELISAYLDGQLEAADRAGVYEHLRDCAACRQLLSDFRALAAAARREGAPPVPADLAERIGRQIDRESAARFTRRWRLVTGARLPLATAAAVLVLSSLWIVWRGRLPGEQPAGPQSDSAPAPALGPAPAQVPSPSPAPFALPPPARSGSVGIEPEVARSLDTLGYVGTREDAGSREHAGRREAGRPSRLRPTVAATPPPPAPLSSEAAPYGGAAPYSKVVPYSKKDVAPAGEKPAQEAKAAAPAPVKEESAAGILALAPGVAGADVGSATAGTTLVFVMAEGRVSILPDAQVVLASGEYLCTVRASGPAEEGALEDLRALASRRGQKAGIAATPDEAAESGSPTGALPAELVILAPPGSGPLPPDLAAELHRRVRILVRERLLALAEAQCGPAPAALRRMR